MSFLLEFEFGAETMYDQENTHLNLDNLLEQSLNQVMFQKYLSYTRLQATFHARKHMLELIKNTKNNSKRMFKFIKYLKKLRKGVNEEKEANKKEIDHLRARIEKKIDELSNLARDTNRVALL